MSVGNVPALIDKEDLPLFYHTLGTLLFEASGSLLWLSYVSLEVGL